MLRDEYQAGLQQAEQSGQELLERYREVPESVAQRIADESIDELLGRREELLRRLAQQSRARGDLPSGGGSERAQFKALSDRVISGLVSVETALSRLLEAEREYCRILEELLDMDWGDDEREALTESRRLSDRIAERLEKLIVSDD